MAGQSSIFPIFLRAEYSDSTAIQRFQSDAQRAAQAASGEIKKVGAALDGIFAKRGTGGALNLGVDELKQAIEAQKQLALAAREVSNATIAAARSNGDFDASLRRTADAASKNAKAQEEQLAAMREQLPLLQRVQAELDKGTTALQARLTAEQNLANFRKAANVNEGALRLASGQASVDRAALSGATLESVMGRTRAVNPQVAQQRAQEAAEMEKVAAAAAKQAAAIADLAQAEAGAANGAQLLQQIYRGTALELNKTGTEFVRAAKSARESAAAFQQAFAAQEAQAEKAAAAIREQAAAVAALKAQINPAAAAQDQFNQKVAFAKGALDRGEISQREYARAVQLASAALREAGQAEVAAAAARNGLTTATRQGTTARQNVINSVRAERAAFTQLGQQLQDVGIQYQMGTSALTIFTQQLPQAAFALTGLADSTNRNKAAIGQFAQILSGPVGGAIVIATALLGPFIMRLFDSGEAAESTAKSVSELVAEKQRSAIEARNAAVAEDVFSRTLDGVTEAARRNREAIKNLTDAKRTDSEETLRNSRIQLANAIALQFNTQQQLFNAKALLDAQVARATGPGQAAELATFGIAEKQAALDKTLANLITGAGEIAKIQKDIDAASILVSVERGLSGAEGAIKRRFEEEIEGLKKSAAARGLSADQIEREAAAIKAREQAALDGLKPSRGDRSAERAARAAAREVNQLAAFSEHAAEQVQRISERFDEQPRLINQAAQASRQLNAIVNDINVAMATSKNLTAAQREDFEKIKAAAADAQDVIGDALLLPFRDLRRESEDRLRIETLLAQGRVDEAAGLQEVLRIEQQLGREADLRLQVERLIAAEQFDQADRLSAFLDGYAQLKADAAARVAEEQRLSRELRAQTELMELQADVARTVRQDLTAILSGRSTDFFGNFKQAIRDLQGARLFEDLFGPAFRQLEEELRGNTPQGRANARATREIETFADTGRAASTAVSRFADAVNTATRRIMRPAANDNPGGFNPRMAMVQAALGASGVSSAINVTGVRPRTETNISRKSSIEIAKEIGLSVGNRIAAEFQDILGPRALQALGQTIGGFIAGKALGGTAGGILGALEGLTGNIKGLEGVSKQLGGLLEGAATGTQVASISKALGLGGSTTGAQIGGIAGRGIGTIIGGPVGGKIGQLVGSIGGNLLGGLFKKTPRGAANLTGVDQFTLSGNNRGGAQDKASDLAGQVSSRLREIARALNAEIGRFAVSIGISGDSVHVDTSGRGRLKKSQGGFDFNDDAEAAIAFAVADAVSDGAIMGLSAAENRLLRAGADLNKGLQDVLDFRSVANRLREIKDPLGFAIEQLNREFTDLIDLFTRAGASTEEFAQLEELYNLQRAEAIKDATDRVVGSLRQLLNDLKIGDSGLSLRSRRNNALTEFNGLAARVAAGDASAFDDFADISRQLLDIERQLFGSTQSYFDRLAQITALSEEAVAQQTGTTTNASNAPNPFEDRAAIARAIDAGTAEQVGWLRAINDNLIALNPANRTGGGASDGGGFGSPFPSQVSNF